MGDGSIGEGDSYESSRQPEVLMRFSIFSFGELACAGLLLASASVGTPISKLTADNSRGLGVAGCAALLRSTASVGTLCVGDTDGGSESHSSGDMANRLAAAGATEGQQGNYRVDIDSYRYR